MIDRLHCFAPGRLLCGLLLLTLVGACGSSPPTRVYTLSAVPPTATVALDATVAVREVVVPGYLDRPQVVRYQETYRLNVAEFARWGEPFGQMVSRVLAADISDRITGADVYQETFPGEMPSTYNVAVVIGRFEPVPEGDVLLEARWVVRRGANQSFAFSQSTTVREPLAVTATDEEQSAAMSRALGKLADAIAQSLARGGQATSLAPGA